MTDIDDPERPFRQLGDDATHQAAPTSAFASSLRRTLQRVLEQPLDADAPDVSTSTLISISQRKATTMPNTTTEPETAQQIITPYICVHDGAAALDWYRDAFGAHETVRYVGDDGRLGHAEFIFQGARIMISDAYPEIGVVAANSYEGSSCALHMEVASCDDLHDRAVGAGATSLALPADQPHGARSATILDPFGHRWMLSQQLTSPTSAEIDERYDDFTVIESGDD